ncbi:MAG: heme exporter protein CcmD [Ectothiorhodospiraceae bacterium]|nr:heme exporter protein CcmD [Ectothiorhodospiraceae bacterium]
MSALAEFLHMGGYAAFVWGSYGICAAVLIANLLAVRARGRRVRAMLARRARFEAAGYAVGDEPAAGGGVDAVNHPGTGAVSEVGRR